MRKPHYWRHASSLNLPTLIACLDCETKGEETDDPAIGEIHTLLIGHCVSYRYDGGELSRLRKRDFTTTESFWHWLDQQLTPQRVLWVIGHNLAFDLGVVGAWHRFRTDDWRFSKRIIEKGVFLLDAYHNNCRVCFCDTFNFYKCSLATIGKSIGLPKLEMPSRDLPTTELLTYCQRDVEITYRAFNALIDYVRSYDLGPWGNTIASLAFNTYRKRFMDRKVLVSDDTESLDLERSCYYGGLVATPFIGKVKPSPIYELDVNSMYPAVCYEFLPCQIEGYAENVSLSVASELSKNFIIFGDVDIETEDYCYPYRIGDRVIYPLGRYRTCLPHQELIRAISLGHVKRVYRLSWHNKARVFATFMEYFSAMKSKHSEMGNEAFRTIDKILMNSLYGKTVQKTPRWVKLDNAGIRELEERYRMPKSTLDFMLRDNFHINGYRDSMLFSRYNCTIQMRDYFGYTEVEVGEHESRDSVPSIGAAITSYARDRLRQYHRIATNGHWFYSDTDSIWVDTEGLNNLIAAKCVAENEMGYLSIKRRCRQFIVHGRKDYELHGVELWHNGTWEENKEEIRILKGIKSTAIPLGDRTYKQLHFPQAIPQIESGRDCEVFIRVAVKHIRTFIDWCIPGHDGWTSPIRLPGKIPDKKSTKSLTRKH